jgi:hypothetical protein
VAASTGSSAATASAASSALSAERRAALRGAKLGALVAGQWGPADRTSHALGTAVALAGPGHVAWVLADEAPERTLGPALVWADRQHIEELHVIVDGPGDAAATVARQAGLFAPPAPHVWAVTGRTVSRAVPQPPPRQPDAPAPPELVDLLMDAGLEIVAEGGVVRGEVNGLEVARIVHGTTSAGVPIAEPQLEVGVGKADRELTAMVHGELAPVDQLSRVVDIVREHRRPGAPRHPLNQLVPERWLRAVLCRNPGGAGPSGRGSGSPGPSGRGSGSPGPSGRGSGSPGLIGRGSGSHVLASLRPAAGVRPRANLTDRDIAIGAGATGDGAPAVVACSVGIALDLVPTAADAREAIDPSARLLLALPERDDHPGTRRLAARLRSPAEVAPVPGDWRAAG